MSSRLIGGVGKCFHPLEKMASLLFLGVFIGFFPFNNFVLHDPNVPTGPATRF
jgi:hypothetical protein